MKLSTIKIAHLHLILAIVLILAIFRSGSGFSRSDIHIPDSYAAIEDALYPMEYIDTSERTQFLKDIQDLRQIAKNTPIHVVHYQANSEEQKLLDQNLKFNAYWKSKQRPTVDVPSNFKPVILILHSDVPVNWQFKSGNKKAKVLFFTGLNPSSIVGSRFEGNHPKFFSFSSSRHCELYPLCRFTKIDYLRYYNDENSYANQVEILFQREVSKFTIVTEHLNKNYAH